MSTHRKRRQRPNPTPPSQPAPPEAAPAPAPKPRNFYSDGFTRGELDLIAAFVQSPSLDDEIWMQRVVNRRLLRYIDGDAAGAGDAPIEVETLVKVAQAMAIGTGRVARLLRDRRALTGEASDTIAALMSAMLDQLSSELGVGE